MNGSGRYTYPGMGLFLLALGYVIVVSTVDAIRLIKIVIRYDVLIAVDFSLFHPLLADCLIGFCYLFFFPPLPYHAILYF